MIFPIDNSFNIIQTLHSQKLLEGTAFVIFAIFFARNLFCSFAFFQIDWSSMGDSFPPKLHGLKTTCVRAKKSHREKGWSGDLQNPSEANMAGMVLLALSFWHGKCCGWLTGGVVQWHWLVLLQVVGSAQETCTTSWGCPADGSDGVTVIQWQESQQLPTPGEGVSPIHRSYLSALPHDNAKVHIGRGTQGSVEGSPPLSCVWKTLWPGWPSHSPPPLYTCSF